MNLAPHLLAALEPVLDHRWRIFPCAPRAKTPLVTDWPRRATSDPDMISRLAKKHPGCNWGLATGQESGVFVLDVDGERGENSLRSLVEQHGTWEKTLAATTLEAHTFTSNGPTLRRSSEIPPARSALASTFAVGAVMCSARLRYIPPVRPTLGLRICIPLSRPDGYSKSSRVPRRGRSYNPARLAFYRKVGETTA